MANCYPLVRPAPTTLAQGNPAFPRRLAGLVGVAGLPATVDTTAASAGDLTAALGACEFSVAIVGARGVTPAGAKAAFALAAELAQLGAVVVSGGALGVDAAAHRGALGAGGRTVVVTGTGIDVDYPRQHGVLFDEVVAGGGALVSMFAPGTQPMPGCFVRRNALIAALADVVVVVEASARSGALHTAAAARQFDRVLAAVPGSVATDRLLADGAALVRTARDVVAAHAGQARHRALPALAAPDRDMVAAVAAAAQGLPCERLAEQLGAPLRTVQRQAMALEAAGWLRVDGAATIHLTGLAHARWSSTFGEHRHGH